MFVESATGKNLTVFPFRFHKLAHTHTHNNFRHRHAQSSAHSVDSPTAAHDHQHPGGSPLRKSFLSAAAALPNNNASSSNIANNNNLNTINQQLNNLGTINHQLNTLQQQLSGLNHQSQTLQKFGASNANIFAQQLYPMNNLSSSEVAAVTAAAAVASQQQQQQHADTFQANQELLHRLQCLTLGLSGQSAANVSPLNNNSFAGVSSPAAGGSNPNAAFMFANANANASATLNRSSNHLFPHNVGHVGNGNLTPSPLLNRSLYSASPSMFDTDSLGVSMERNLDRNSGSSGTGTACNSRNSPFIRPLSQQPSVATLTSSSAGGVDCHTPLPSAFADASRSARDAANQRSLQRPSDYVQLQVTDESGNVRKMSSATPANIQRTTSEKVPHRSQLMSEVQRTTWARHTTK